MSTLFDLERRLTVLTEKLEDIICKDHYRSDILENCDYGAEIIIRLDSLLDLAYEFDRGRLTPERHNPVGEI
ncbi:MAG: hypothetical protein HYU74_03155 [Dechloromonas sp.]|nr:hypothetical protein [Dechloromonas sp.]